MTDHEWSYWEQWTRGWEVVLVDERPHLHFEGEDIERLLVAPHVYEELPDFVDAVPNGPSVDSRTEPRNWLIRFAFENGWEALVYPEFGIALNAAAIIGLNARLYRGTAWPLDQEVWDDRSLLWQAEEQDALGGSHPELDDPDHLLLCLATIAALPSDR